MTKEELLQLLSRRSDELEQIIDERLTLLELCSLATNNVKDDLYSLPDCDIEILIKLLLFAIVKSNLDSDYTYEDIMNISDSLINLFEKYKIEIILSDISILGVMHKYGIAKEVIQFLTGDKLFDTVKLCCQMVNSEIVYDEKLLTKFFDATRAFKKIISKVDINEFLVLLEKIDNDDLMLIFNLYKNHDIISKEKVRFKKELEECRKEDAETYKFIKPHIKINTHKKFFNDCFNKNVLYDIEETKKTLNIIIQFYKAKFPIWESERKRALKEKNKLDEVKIILESYNKDEITNVEGLIKNIKDEKIKYSILKYVFEYNKNYYRKIVDEYNKLKNNSELAYSALLSSNGIDVSSFDIHAVMHHEREDLIQMIKLLKQLFNEKTDYLFAILTITNLKVVEEIYSLTINGIISKLFIEENMDIFEIDSKKFETILINLDLLNSKGINPSILINDNDMLLINSNIMNFNLNALINYDLVKSMKTTSNHHYLGNVNTAAIIDRLFELGYDKFLREDLNILNNSNLKRLELLYAMNIIIESKEEFDKIISSNKDFFIRDNSELDKYIPNILKYHNKIDFNFDINELERFKNSQYTYSINGVIISSVKVKRLIEQEENMYDALFYNMYLSDDDYNRVIQELKSHVLIK